MQLSELRKKMGIRQEDIKLYSQSGISKIESRKDMKISTLIEYLHVIGLGMEIKVFPKDVSSNRKNIVLLRA
ncbi:MAG: XRE family transcriptional regulator [Leptospiraceae bacterium]|nr:XRE family transcriptional regulator [Leptospiraceae bacterium]